MAQLAIPERKRKFLPSLEGVRGFAFLAVFLYHYLSTTVFIDYSNRPWMFPLKLSIAPVWISVPIFFVLSGYLITGILIDTRDKEGYFRVFYSRRCLRVFPLYYLTLLIVGLYFAWKGDLLSRRYWMHFLYIQNLLPGYENRTVFGYIGHLWSMGVEEQFYMLWPLVVWIFPNPRVLLRVTLILIAACSALRFVYPYLHSSPLFYYYWTPTRLDAILMGTALATLRGEKLFLQLERIAKYVALAGLIAIYLSSAHAGGDELLSSSRHVALVIPLWNLTAAAVVLAVMQEGSILCRLCSVNVMRWLGARSYALYLFHVIYLQWFVYSALPHLDRVIRHSWAILITIGAAFVVTILLAAVSYRLVEEPAMNLKKIFRYGPSEQRLQIQ